MSVSLYHGDNLAVLKTMADNSIDSVVTDPPYGLKFMGKKWDHDVPSVAFWQEVYRVLKPGGHVLSFSGTRTYHRMVVAIEDAGFEIRDQIGWLYGSGFPKSMDVSKAIDKAAGAERVVLGPRVYADGTVGHWGTSDKYAQDAHTKSLISGTPKMETAPATPEAQQWQGWGTALKPAWEPCVVARKPLEGTVAENVLEWGTGAINIDGCRVEPTGESRPRNGDTTKGATNFAAKPGVGGGAPEGRFPANVIHDGSDEVEQAFATFGDKSSPWIGNQKGNTRGAKGGLMFGGSEQAIKTKPEYSDSGTASRFFYCAKASKKDRAGSKHPTVKPVALMAYLCKLVTPPGGTVLDPFAGSGTTGEAAVFNGFNVVLIELESEYVDDIRNRLEAFISKDEII